MDPTQLGSNRTGTQVSPRQFRAMQEGVEAMTAAMGGSDRRIAMARGGVPADRVTVALTYSADTVEVRVTDEGPRPDRVTERAAGHPPSEALAVHPFTAADVGTRFFARSS
mgnify:CR=1 FL=1